MTPPKTYHLLPVSDPTEPGWLLRGARPSRAAVARGATRAADYSAAGVVDEVTILAPLPRLPGDTWWVDRGALAETRDGLRARRACPACAAGTPCDAWDGTDLPTSGYRPRPKPVDPVAAARVALGVAKGADAGDLTRAWLAAVRRHHPDAGGDGDAAALARAKDARDVIAAARRPR